ncbi:hypothetical protein B0H65DRAFT_436847 [Neurospora tetraspora]|uniref:Uncharacterized protein n=1 Tax=Neurospora tetraspora TaxID=94610 RepID=A0AAE0MJA4_9PEZI|nr:hypothetical protein B0H65DRAFT_436847 [Neurospora tetraspora]
MRDHKGKAHSLRGAIVGLFKRSPIRKKQENKSIATTQAVRPYSPDRLDSEEDIPQADCHDQLPYPEDDDPQADAPRGRPNSWTPSRGRAQTPHPRASESRNRNKKAVRWADPLEQPTPEKEEPATLEREQTAERKRDLEMEEQKQATDEKEEEMTAKEHRPCELRQSIRSSIPRPKAKIAQTDDSKPHHSRSPSKAAIASKASGIPTRQAPQRPPSPLVPQDAPAPLRIPRAKDSLRLPKTKTIPSSVPNDKDQAKDKPFTANSSRKREPSKLKSENNPQPNLGNSSQPSRSFSFQSQPEVITTGSRGSRQHRQSSITEEKPLPPPTTSFLKGKPRRFTSSFPPKSTPASSDGNSASAKALIPSSVTTTSIPLRKEPGPSGSRLASTRSSIPSSVSSPTFQSAKGFWNKIDSGSSGNANCGTRIPVSDSKLDVTSSNGTTASRASQVPKASFNTAKSFWTEMSDNSSCVAVVGTNSRSSDRDLDISDLLSSSPFISTPASNPSSSHLGRSSQLTSGSGSSSYKTAESHLSNSKANSSTCTASSAFISTGSSLQNNYTPSIQSQLWDDLMKFCTSETSTAQGEQYCGCDGCVWTAGSEVDRCSAVACVDSGKCKKK